MNSNYHTLIGCTLILLSNPALCCLKSAYHLHLADRLYQIGCQKEDPNFSCRDAPELLERTDQIILETDDTSNAFVELQISARKLKAQILGICSDNPYPALEAMAGLIIDKLIRYDTDFNPHDIDYFLQLLKREMASQGDFPESQHLFLKLNSPNEFKKTVADTLVDHNKILTLTKKLIDKSEKRDQNSSRILEAAAIVLYHKIKTTFNSSYASQFIKNTYENTSIYHNLTGITFLYYMFFHKYEYGRIKQRVLEAIPVLELLLGEERFQTPLFYNLLALYYSRIDDNQAKLIHLLRHAHQEFSSSNIFNNLILASALLGKGQASEAAPIFNDIIYQHKQANQPAHQRPEWGLSHTGPLSYKFVRSLLVLSLLNSDQSETASPFFHEEQLEALSQRQTQVRLLKERLESIRREQVQANSSIPTVTAKPSRQKLMTPPIQEQDQSSSPFSNRQEGADFFEESPLQPKTKVKTRPLVPIPPQPQSQSRPKVELQNSSPEIQLASIESLLSGNKRALEIFNRFFLNYYENVRSSAIHITFEETSLLMHALGQDFNPSKGKGSHTKITLRRDQLQPDTQTIPEETVIILSRQSFLIPSQIDQIQDTFIQYYLFPADLEEKLIQKGALPPNFRSHLSL